MRQLTLFDVRDRRQRVPEHHARGDLRERDADGLGDERHGAGRARVHLQHVDRVVADGELHVDEPDHAEGLGERARLSTQSLDLVLAERVRRQRAGGVTGVNARLLDVLHHAPDDHPRPVRDGIHIDLDRVLEELVDEDRVLGRHPDRLLHELAQILIVVDDPHRAPAEHVRRPDEDGIADPGGNRLGLVEGARGGAGRLVEPELGEERAEALTILGAVDRVG